MDERMRNLDWKSDEFRKRCLQQLEIIVTKLGNPAITARDVEAKIFAKSSTKQDYIMFIKTLIARMPQQQQQQFQNQSMLLLQQQQQQQQQQQSQPQMFSGGDMMQQQQMQQQQQQMMGQSSGGDPSANLQNQNGNEMKSLLQRMRDLEM